MTDFWRETILTASSSSFSVNLAEAGIVFFRKTGSLIDLEEEEEAIFLMLRESLSLCLSRTLSKSLHGIDKKKNLFLAWKLDLKKTASKVSQ